MIFWVDLVTAKKILYYRSISGNKSHLKWKAAATLEFMKWSLWSRIVERTNNNITPDSISSSHAIFYIEASSIAHVTTQLIFFKCFPIYSHKMPSLRLLVDVHLNPLSVVSNHNFIHDWRVKAGNSDKFEYHHRLEIYLKATWQIFNEWSHKQKSTINESVIVRHVAV